MERPRNLLLISADSLRVDRLAVFRTGGLELDALDRLAARGVTYRRAQAVTPWTAPAMVSVFTGLYPPSHGVQVRDDTTPQALPTLARLAEDAGLRVGNFSFFSGISYFRNLGLPPAPEGLAYGREPEVFARWLDERPDDDFFAWIHLLEPHLPYGADGYRAKELQIEGSSGLEATQLKATVPVGTAEFAPGDREPLLELYDRDVRRLGDRLMDLLEALTERGLLESTLIVFVADHGEELLEDGWVGHASTAAEAKLIPEVLDIPLLVSGPGVLEPGSTSEARVQQIDLLPALVRLFDWPAPNVLDGFGLPGLGPRRWRSLPERSRSFFDTSVGGNLTPAERSFERLQGISDGRCLVRSRTAPGSAEGVDSLEVVAGGCDRVADLRKDLDAWRRDQAAQRLSLLEGGASSAGPDLQQVESFAEVLDALPADRALLRWPEVGGLISLEWNLEEPAWIQYEVGQGLLSVDGVFRADKPGSIAFGPFPEGFWNDLAGYNPFRYRVIHEELQQRSPWQEFRLEKTTR
ncbi:MAG: sulfatase [Acidobacteriota bacterium]